MSTTPSLLARVIRSMEKIAPLSLADHSWDNVGLLIEAPVPRSQATRVFLTIDLTKQVLDECLQDPFIGVIIAYHPPLFRSFKRLTLKDEKQAIALRCAAAGVSVYCPHTALDHCTGGINDWLAKGLGQGQTFVIQSMEAPIGQDMCGSGRIHVLDTPVELMELVQTIKTFLKLPFLRLAKSTTKSLVRTIAICAGSGSSVLKNVEADVYLTGEMSHHEILSVVDQGVHLILTEHSNSERGYLTDVLQHRLQSLLRLDQGLGIENDVNVEVVVSNIDSDPIEIYQRIEREIRQIKKDSACQIQVNVVQDNLSHLKGIFKGPDGTPYEGGTFVVDIQIPEDYPYKPPKMKFDTKVYHPNISSQTGAICLDILKDNWTPVLTIKTALISLQSLLFDPVPTDPQDAEVAKHYLSNRQGFDDTAREWTRLYAKGLLDDSDESNLDPSVIQRLLDMGFERTRIIHALRRFQSDEMKSIEFLLSNQ